ncbi:hypothetical protein [Streptomyces sp. NBRC 109706]|uniref:hypothetical protein n=1 Tax=Streptomyces sp. NBRC 109706 TaxID=1550035 RepID=UPI0007839E5E|nr:hypothetical protein [Streptomyces sp. NBRC 109706]
MSGDDLELVVGLIVRDATRAAVAPKDDGPAGYDWWKVLFALFPNSKPTHAKRGRDQEVIRSKVAALFAPDGVTGRSWPCTFCAQMTGTAWGKSNLPLFDTSKALNNVPPGVPGWPICRGCRVAIWTLPYGAWVTAGSATVFTCEDEAAERRFVEHSVARSRRIVDGGFEALAADGVEDGPFALALQQLRDVGGRQHAAGGLASSTLWRFKNDNEEPWLRASFTRRAVPRFLALVQGNAPLREAWALLEEALVQRDRRGRVVASGAGEAARLVFEAEDGTSRSLLWALHELRGSERLTSAQRHNIARLAGEYGRHVLGIDDGNLAPAAEVLATWIWRGGPEGQRQQRRAEYLEAAPNPYKLGLVMMRANSRLFLAGLPVRATVEDWRPLLQSDARAWARRLLLGAAVDRQPVG